jgi:hypothetical protein
MPIDYVADGGYYEIEYATTPGGPYAVHGHTVDKLASSYTVDGLDHKTQYYFVVRSHTPAHDQQQNDLDSLPREEVPAKTLVSCGEAIVPTTHQAEAFGTNSTLDGSPLPVESCVLAVDPDGVVCGAFLVASPGAYGPLIIYGDDPATPEDEGALPGDTIHFTVDGCDAPQTFIWEEGSSGKVELQAACCEEQIISLQAGWNLVSIRVEPMDPTCSTPITTVADVLAPIQGSYDAVLSFVDGGARSYYPDLPPSFNDLKSIDCEHGYWIKMNQAAVLTVRGTACPADHPLALSAGWNLVSYLPRMDITVADALTTIDGQYEAVLGFVDGGARSYYPDLPPSFNDLKCLREHHGYWIKMSQAATLSYPVTGTCSDP